MAAEQYLAVEGRGIWCISNRDVTDSESDGIWHFFQNLKSNGYLKSDCFGLDSFVSVHL